MTRPDSKISELLKDEKFGKSASEIAELTSLDRRTVMKALDIMAAQGKVEFKPVGMAKLWRMSKIPFLSVLERDDESAVLLKKVLDSLEDGITIIDKSNRVIFANKVIKDMVGKESAKGTTCHKLLMDKDHICNFCPAEKSFETKDVCSETIVQGKGKDKALIRYISTPILDNDGNVAGVIETIRNLGKVSELKKILG